MKCHKVLLSLFSVIFFACLSIASAQEASSTAEPSPEQVSLDKRLANLEKYYKRGSNELPKIIEHYVGEHGVPFPDKLNPMFIIPKRQLKLATMSHFAAQADLMGEMLSPPVISKCKESKSVIKIREFPGKDLNKIYTDILFIDEKKMPINPKESFGESAMIYAINDDPRNAGVHVARGMNVPCLPYRIRMTGKHRAFLKGFNALRNFDKNPNGPGVYVRAEIAKEEEPNDE